jgi:hypothetical protein
MSMLSPARPALQCAARAFRLAHAGRIPEPRLLLLILGFAIPIAALSGCAARMTDDELSSSERTRSALEGTRGDSMTLSRSVGSENDYFITRVMSASKSRDGTRLVVSIQIEAKEDTNALISLVPDSAQAIDNEAGYYKVSNASGIGQDWCGGIFSRQNFTQLTPSSVHTLNFVLADDQGSHGDEISFAASFCTILQGMSMFRLPISVANIPVRTRS